MLLNPIKIGALTLNNRTIMAPLTRARSNAAHQPNEMMAEYYAQRASAGLLITECTMIMENTSSFATEPGIYTQEQVEGWKLTTDAVHKAGGKIFMQIWHAGRAAHPDLNNGEQPVSASAVAIDAETHTQNGKVPYTTPRALTDDEIPSIVAAFKQAAEHAIAAGFDGVEVHGANGYLIDQFLRDGANQRSAPYGGSMENRARLLFEVLTAVSDAIGSERVGVRFSPLNSFNSMKDSDPVGLVSYLGDELNKFDLAYVHLMRADFFGQQQADVVTPMREHYKGNLIVNMGYTAEEAEQAIVDGKADAVAFGTGFLATPDLPERIAQGIEWNTPDQDTFYSPGPNGYTDYPTLEKLGA